MSRVYAAEPAYQPGDYEKVGDIFDAMYGFKTFNGKSVIDLLAAHGFRIQFLEVNTVESLGPRKGDVPGDVVYDLQIVGTAKGKLPCALGSMKGTQDFPITEEFVRRAGRFPLPDETSGSPTGALMYWAATGRCSKAY